MSVPAPMLPSPSAPVPAPAPRHRPAGNPAGPPVARPPASRPRPSTSARSRARTRRWRHPAFFLFTGIVVSVLVMGLVALNALTIQTTYRLQVVRQQVRDLAEEQVLLNDEVASLSSPARVAAWAHAHQLAMPEPGDTIILPVPGVPSPPDPAREEGG